MHSADGRCQIVKQFKSDAVDDSGQGSPELSEQQVAEVIAVLKQADAGDFATAEEVEKVMNKRQCGAR